MVIRGQRVHPQAELQRPGQLVACLARRHAVHHLSLRGLQVLGDRAQLTGEVVVDLQVPADRLHDRRRVLPPGGEGELVRPHRLVPEDLLIGLYLPGQEGAALVAGLQGAQHVLSRGPFESLGDRSLLSLHPLLDLPQLLDRVPVAVLGRALQPAHER